MIFGRVLAAIFVLLIAPSFVFAQEKIIRSHGISDYGELKYSADFKHLDYVNPNAPKGGQYTDWSIGTFDSLHRYTIKGTSASLGSLPYETLMVSTADDFDGVYGLLAHAVEYPENRQWVKFFLRPEARFSNGDPVTAHDIVFSYNILLEKGIPSLKTVFKDFKSVTALDDHTVEFVFHEGAATKTLPSTAGIIPAFSKKFWEGKDFSDSTLDTGPGSGPYVVHEVDPGRSLVLKRNPDYWGKDLPINIGRDNFDFIREEFYGDTNSAFEAFKAGQLLINIESDPLKWAERYNFPAIEKGWVVKEEVPDGAKPNANGLFFNLRKEKFQDPRVREAIELLFNFEWTNETLFFGLFERMDSFWENSELEASGLPTEAELAILEPYREHFPESLFTQEPPSPPVMGKRQLGRSELRKASALLEEAGWELVDGKLKRDGKVFSIEFMIASEPPERYINPFIENLKRVGIEATLKRVDVPQFLERRGKHDFDILTSRHVTGYTPSIGLRQWFGSANADKDTRNFTGIKNLGVDALIEDALNTQSQEEMITHLRALDRAIRSLRIWVPRWYKPNHWVAYWDVYSRPETQPPLALGTLDFWWWDEEKYQQLKAQGALK